MWTTLLFALVSLVPAAGGHQELPPPLGAASPFSLDVIERGADEGLTRVAVSSPTGAGGPLLLALAPGFEAFLETLILYGPAGRSAAVSLDGQMPRQAEAALAFGATRLHFEQALHLDARGRGGRLAVTGPGLAPQLPPFTAILRIQPAPGGSPGGGLRQFTGFETGDLGEFDKVVGGASVQSSIVRSGAFAMRSLAAANQYAYATLFDVPANGFGATGLGIDDLYLSFQFRVASWDQRVRFAEVGGESGATKLRVELEPDGRISLEDDGLTRRFGQQVLATNRWYRIDLLVGTGTSTHVQLKIDGQVEIDVNDANTSNQLTRRVHIGRAASSGGASDFYYDDVVLSNQSHAGDARVVFLKPNGPGAASTWLGSSLDLDDWPHDGEASYAVSNGAGASVWALGSAAGVSGQVLGVKALAVQRRTGGSFTSSALRLRSGGLNFDTASGDGGGTYRLRSRLFAADPATGGAWQLPALESLELGLVQLEPQSSLATRVTAVGTAVLFAPGGGAASSVRQFTGFETGDLGEFDKTVGAASVQGAVVRSGNFALRAQASAGSYSYATLFDVTADGFGALSLDLDELYLSFQFRVANWSQRVRFAEVSGVAGTAKVRVELEPDGRVSLRDAGSSRFYSLQALGKNQWYRIDLLVGTGTSTRLQLLIDGQVQIDLNDANASSEAARRVHLGRTATSGGSSDFYYDDVVLADQAHAGDARVLLLAPNGAGAFSAWSGSSFDLDDWPHDGDGSFAASNGPGAFTCALASAAGVTGQILGVKALAVQRRTGASASSALRLRSAGLDFDTAAGDGGSSYRLRSRLFAGDPAGGGAWQLPALADLEVGLVQLEPQVSLATRATAVGAAVLFAPGN